MKKLLLAAGLLAGIAGLPAARAQVFRPGLLVRTQGDTLRGEVEDASWEEEPTLVRLRTTAGGEVTTYPAAALQAIKFEEGQYFRREVVPFDRQAKTDINQLQEGLLINSRPTSLLVEVLVDGPGKLLHTAVGDVQHYFVGRPGQPYIELTERHYLRRQEGRLLVADANNYRATLTSYFGDCPAVAASIREATFTQTALAQVVQAYNQQCSPTRQAGPLYLSRPTSRRVALNLGVVAGGRYVSAQLRNSAGSGGLLDNFNLDGQLHPAGGAYLDVLLPARRAALHVAGLLATYGRSGAVLPAGGGYSGSLNGQQTVLELRIGGRLLRPLRGSGARLVLGTGITLPVDFTKQDPLLRYSSTTTGSGIEYAPYTYPFSRFIPYLEAGVRHNQLTLLVDGRLGSEQTFNTAFGRPVNSSTFYYNFSAWYVGVTLGLSLLRQQ